MSPPSPTQRPQNPAPGSAAASTPNTTAQSPHRVVALSGGIGGAKLARGLDRILPHHSLSVIANTGDDFVHLGLSICPDIDTLLYTLSDRSDRTRGWGRANETWTFMNALRELGGADWFQLGDGDLALHVLRSHQLATGTTLSEITDNFAQMFGLTSRILPMSNDPVRTRVKTPEGWCDFQDYFVRQKTEPRVLALAFDGADDATANPAALNHLTSPETDVILICPSNPLISIDPILAVPGIRAALRASAAPVVAVSPIIAGASVKGPTAKMLAELNQPVSATSVLLHYKDILDGFIVDPRDVAALTPHASDIAIMDLDIMMHTDDDRDRVASAALSFAQQIKDQTA